MTGPRIGSLFSGYGGLDLGVQAVLGGDVVWHVEYDAAPSKILAHHWPTVPNYGDVTTLDLTAVEPIDVLTAGYPCQPFSIAGKRKGSTDDRHLWPYVLDAIRYLRPGLVVLENVRGHLTLGFDRVLGDLAEARYDAEWICLPAAEAGAPHRRERIFILAYPNDAGRGEQWWPVAVQTEQPATEHDGADAAPDAGSDEPERRGVGGDVGSAPIEDQGASGERQRLRDAVGDRGPVAPDASGARRSQREDAGAGRSDATEDWSGGVEPERDGGERTDWGPHALAISRWESVLGRLAPAPSVLDGRTGKHRLNPAFVEWMMGLPAGHVTDVGITRSEALKALGNGVVWQQAALALSILLEATQTRGITND